MRKTRFVSLLFLVWSIAFFFVPEFRQVFHVLLPLSIPGTDNSLVELSPQGLEETARRAAQQRDARTLAFVALHLDNVKESLQYADQAVAIDPGLTWVYGSILPSAVDAKQNPPDLHSRITQFEKWDPDNAVPYFLEAREIARRKNIAFLVPRADLDTISKETEWCQAMQKGFTSPHYDFYDTRRFELERSWLRENGLDSPAIVLASLWNYPFPNLLQIRAYANLLVDKYGKEAEDAGKLPQALGYYWTAEHFAERMRLNGRWRIERLMATALLKIAGKRLVPALHKAGQTDPAITLEAAEQELDQEAAALRGKDPLAQSAINGWTAWVVNILAGLVLVLGPLTVLTAVYTNAKRWVRPERRGRLFQVLTLADDYLPVLFFLACVGLYLGFYPYAQNFHHYMTASGEIHDLEPLWYNVSPNLIFLPDHTVPIGNPFRPYVWYALAGLILVVLTAIPYHRRGTLRGELNRAKDE